MLRPLPWKTWNLDRKRNRNNRNIRVKFGQEKRKSRIHRCELYEIKIILYTLAPRNSSKYIGHDCVCKVASVVKFIRAGQLSQSQSSLFKLCWIVTFQLVQGQVLALKDLDVALVAKQVLQLLQRIAGVFFCEGHHRWITCLTPFKVACRWRTLLPLAWSPFLQVPHLAASGAQHCEVDLVNKLFSRDKMLEMSNDEVIDAG